jgi:NADH-quinone oxidoreductase subunit M
VSIAEFILSLWWLLRGVPLGSSGFQLQEFRQWIDLGPHGSATHTFINYHLGADGISLFLVLLTTFLTVVSILCSWKSIEKRVKEFFIMILLLEVGVIGVFLSLDLFLFFLFWEVMLIPMYFLIGIWGHERRIYAAVKFFLYTFAGSVLMLAAIIFLYDRAGTFDYSQIQSMLQSGRLALSSQAEMLLFLAFFIAFAIKVPLFPLHTWLPDAHVEAPTGGSVVLAAIMLKLGAYGFLRFSLPITPDASHKWAGFMIALSLIAVVYIGFVALVQKDMKKLVAYSSVAHMGFVTFGFFIFNELGMSGGIVQMVSHGFVSGAMFLCIGVLYDRVHSREIAAYGGVVNTMPKFASFAVLFAMANCGLPGTAGFVGEWMVILGAVKFNFWFGFIAATTLIFGAAYTLWMVKRVYFGAVGNDHVRELADIDAREFTMLALLAVSVLFMGVYPKPFTDVMHVSVDGLLKHAAVSKIPSQ